MSVAGTTRMKTRAPTLTTSDISLAIVASVLRVTSGLTYSRQMLRLKRLAAAIDITDAGTNAPIAIAAKATPVNQLGNMFWKRSAMALLLRKSLLGFTPAAMAMKPNRAMRPSMKE